MHGKANRRASLSAILFIVRSLNTNDLNSRPSCFATNAPIVSSIQLRASYVTVQDWTLLCNVLLQNIGIHLTSVISEDHSVGHASIKLLEIYLRVLLLVDPADSPSAVVPINAPAIQRQKRSITTQSPACDRFGCISSSVTITCTVQIVGDSVPHECLG